MANSQIRLLKVSIIVTLISLFGKAVGFLRDAVIAAYYGANWRTDAFFFAQSMPGIIFPAVCNSLSTAFLSIYVSRSVEDKNTVDEYGSKAVTFSTFLAIALSALGIMLTPVIAPIFAPGFSAVQLELAKRLTRITMASFVLIMIQYMLGAILSSKKLFYAAQIAALFYNLSIILITIVLGRNQDMDTLTYTVVIGHVIQVLALILFVRRQFHYSFSLKVFDDDTFSLVKLTLPIIFGNSIVQINNIVDKILSSLFGEGAMSSLSYSNTLNRFVTGIVITTLSTVIYPVLAEHFSKNETDDFSSTIRNSIIIGLIVLVPVSIVTTMCAPDIVKIVYERGSFDAEATKLTSLALTFYGMMYVFSAVQEIIDRAFYGMKDTKTPLKTAAVAIVSNAIMSYIFSVVFRLGLGGIALGTTLSALFASILLIFALRKRVPNLNLGRMKDSSLKILTSALVVVVFVMILKSLCANFIPLFRFLTITCLSFLLHFLILWLLKCDELNEVKTILMKTLKK